jgi:HK97 family phage major capsid protein
MAATYAELRAQLKDISERAWLIEQKYPEGDITDEKDQQASAELSAEYAEVEAKATQARQNEERRGIITSRLAELQQPAAAFDGALKQLDQQTAKTHSPGRQFCDSYEYKSMQASGAFNSPLNNVSFGVQLKDGTSLMEWKTTLFASSDTSGGAFVANDRQPGYIDLRQRELSLLNIIPRMRTNSDTVEYIQQSSFTNNAAMVAEATGSAQTGTDGRKPESALAFAAVTAAVRTLAHWIPVTNRMLQDSAQIRGVIDQQLLLGLDLVLESQVVSGGGTGEDFLGIVGQAVNIVSKGADSSLDAILKGATLVQTVGLGRPSVVVMHPTDFQAVRLLRESASTATPGTYLMGLPSTSGATTIFGMPVVISLALPAGTALVGDFGQACALWDREQSAIRVGTINDQLIRNQQTILAELRAAFTCHRPKMITKVTGL